MHYVLLHFIKPCVDKYPNMYTHIKSVSVFILPSIQTLIYTTFAKSKAVFFIHIIMFQHLQLIFQTFNKLKARRAGDEVQHYMMQSGPTAQLWFSGNGWNDWVTMCMVRFEILMVGFISVKWSVMFYHVDWCVVTDTLEAYVAWKFRVSNIISLSLKQMPKKLKFFGTFTIISWLAL